MDPVDRDFQHFQRTGDPSALAAVFEASAPGLLRLAESLVRDPSVAEDLLQETFLVAIARRGSWRGESGVRSWLTGILVRRAHKLRRSDARVPDPLRVPGGRTPDPSEESSCAEFREALRRGLAALSDPYGPLVRAHLERGLRPVEIAREVGRSPDVVRKQLARGMELLRRGLPAGIVGSLALSLRAQRGLSAVRAEVLAAARDLPPTLAEGADGGNRLARLAAQPARAVAWAVAVVLVGMLAWGLAMGPPGPPVPGSRTARSTGDEPESAGVAGAEAGRRVPAVEPDARGVAVGGAELVVEVLDTEGRAVVGAGVLAVAQDGRDLHRGAVRRVTDASGRAELQVAAPGSYELRLDRRDELGLATRRIAVTDRAREVVQFRVGPGQAVDGLVLDAAGLPVAGAVVWRHEYGVGSSTWWPPEHSYPVATTDRTGQFRVEGVQDSTWLEARCVGAAPSTAIRPRLGIGPEQPGPELRLRGPGARLHGRVLGTKGGTARAEVILCRPQRRAETRWHSPQVAREQSHVQRRVPIAADGTFVAEDLYPGEVEVRAFVAGRASVAKRVRLVAGSSTEVVLGLQEGGGLDLRLLAEGGDAVAGARVRLLGERDDSEILTDAAGCAHFAELPAGDYELRLDPGTHFGLRRQVGVVAGKTGELELELAPLGRLSGRVFGPDGAPWPGCLVQCVRPMDEGEEGERTDRIAPRRFQRTRTDSQGRFWFDVVPGGAHRVEVLTSPGARPVVFPAASAVVAPCDDLELRVGREQIADSWLEVRLTDGEGVPVGGLAFQDLEGWPLPVQATRLAGSYRIGPLVAGRYRIVAAPAWGPRFRLLVADVGLGAGERRDLGVRSVLAGDELAHIDARIVGPDGAPLREAYLGIRRVGSVPEDAVEPGDLLAMPSVSADSSGRVAATLPPGTYRLFASAEGCRTRVWTVELPATEILQRDFGLSPGVDCLVRAGLPDGVQRGWLSMIGPDGRPLGLFDDQLPKRSQESLERPDPTSWRVCLEPGLWTALLRGVDGSSWRCRFVVSAGRDGAQADGGRLIEPVWSPN